MAPFFMLFAPRELASTHPLFIILVLKGQNFFDLPPGHSAESTPWLNH